MTIYTRKNGLATVLRIKLMLVLYVLWICQWYSIFLRQVDASRPANLCHPKRTLPAGGELVQAFMGKYAPEHQIIIAPKRLVVPCISES
jgi:hypothetical protein